MIMIVVLNEGVSLMRNFLVRSGLLSMLIVSMLITGVTLAAPPQPSDTRIPVRLHETFVVPAGYSLVESLIYTVPDDKRFVIETVNVFALTPADAPVRYIRLETLDSPPTELLAFLPYSVGPNDSTTVALESVRLYVEPNEALYIMIALTPPTYDLTIYTAFSGYLLPEDSAELGP